MIFIDNLTIKKVNTKPTKIERKLEISAEEKRLKKQDKIASPVSEIPFRDVNQSKKKPVKKSLTGSKKVEKTS